MDGLALESVLKGCLLPDNSARDDAEARLETWKNEPAFVPALLRQLSANSAADIRHVAAITLRKHLTKCWGSLETTTKAEIKSTLMQLIFNEQERPVRRAIVGIAAVVAELCMGEGSWPELLPGLQHMASAPTASHREVALTLFHAIADNVPLLLQPHFGAVTSVVVQALQDREASVRLAGVEAYGTLLRLAPDDGSGTSVLQAALPLLLRNLEAFVQNAEAEPLTAGVTVLLDTIEAPAPLLLGCLPAVSSIALLGVRCTTLPPDARCHCLQIVNWLALYKPRQLARSGVMPDIVQQLCATAAEDDQDSDPDTEAASTNRCAVECLDELALSLPSKHVLPVVLSFVEAAVSQGALDSLRRGALRALSAVAEGCADKLGQSTELPSLLHFVLACLGAANPHLRTSAAVCLGQLANHVQPVLSESTQTVLLPLLSQLQNETDTRAAEAMVYAADSIVMHLDMDVAAAALPSLMPPLLALLEQGTRNMHDTLLTCVASAAASSGQAFAPYAERVLMLLQRYMGTTAPDDLPARAAATECAGHVVESLGRAAARQLLPPFIHSALDAFHIDNPQLHEYSHGLLSLAARLLEDAYVPYLPASVEQAFRSLDATDGLLPSLRGEGDGVGNLIGSEQPIMVRTGIVDEKAAALCALGLYAEHTRESFFPYVERAMTACREMTEYLHADPRRQALEALAKLVRSAVTAHPAASSCDLSPEARIVVDACVSTVLSSVAEDPERLVVASCMVAIQHLCECLPDGLLLHAMAPQAAAMVEVVAVVLKGDAPCQAASDDDGKPDEVEASVEAEEALVESAADAVSALALALGADAFACAWQAHLGKPFLARMEVHRSSVDLRGALLGNVAEIFERAGAAISRDTVDVALPLVCKETESEAPTNRQHAVFALGHMIRTCPHVTADDVPRLLGMYLRPLLSDKVPAVVDNACGALARALLRHRLHLPLKEAARGLLDCLPLRVDFEESTPVVECLKMLASSGACDDLYGGLLLALATCASQDCGSDVRKEAASALQIEHVKDPRRVEDVLAALSAEQWQQLRLAAGK